MKILKIFLVLLFTLSFADAKNSYSLKVDVVGLKNSKGVVQVSLYNTDGSIPDKDYTKFYKPEFDGILYPQKPKNG